MSKTAMEVTVLMPCLNEAETLGACIRTARRTLDRLGVLGEVLVSDNGSADGSPAIAGREGARVIHVPVRGYGSALLAGIEASRGELIVMGDADESYDFEQLGSFLERLRGGADLVMGCRFPAGGGTIQAGAMPWLHRWVGNPLLSFLGRLFFRTRVHDFHCGLRAVRRVAMRRLDLRTYGMEFASEMVIKAALAGMKIEEVPVTLRRDKRSRRPHLRRWRDGWRHLRFMLLFSPRWLFLVPGAALVLAGVAFGARLWAGPIRVGRIGFDTNTLLVCAVATIVGVQLCSFGFVARVFAAREGFLPFGPRYESLFHIFTLERGLAVGVVGLLAGVGFLVRALLLWRAAGFGALGYSEGLRLVIPAITFITIGTQVVFSSFLLSLLGLRSNR
jgi:glycosyltransferase involved in cell wall biosynthesis